MKKLPLEDGQDTVGISECPSVC